MLRHGDFWGLLDRFRLALVCLIGLMGYSAVLMALRESPFRANPFLDTYMQMAGCLIAFTFAANALVRFRGTRDRASLILAFGFALAGLIEAGTSVMLVRGALMSSDLVDHVSLSWLAGQTLLSVLVLAALTVERRVPFARDPGKEIAGATLIVGGLAYLTSVFYFLLPTPPKIHPGALFPRPWDLLPAAIFTIAAFGYSFRLRRVEGWLDRALVAAAVMDAMCHLSMSQSQHILDAPFTLAHVLLVSSFAVVLGGTLLDNAQLFDQVSHMAASDPLTGLSNHRRLIEVLESELQRSRRTGRSFALLLFDLDGLKKINDKYGHLTGSRAIRRLGLALRENSRAIDTPARYGGDEFALVLPESDAEDAYQVSGRICDQLANDGEQPRVTVSVGAAVYPKDGTAIDKLFAAADRELYRMKGHGQKKIRLGHVAACL
ncbi:MAG TPA: GGDEF domain-containing protein [Candidatus Acidoferrum sp.]|nr:GGDEF domain-containing protein [Candidatus Acidoferrum sp.]